MRPVGHDQDGGVPKGPDLCHRFLPQWNGVVEDEASIAEADDAHPAVHAPARDRT
jgi:hypothetical protein